jgi:hypothetical protein
MTMNRFAGFADNGGVPQIRLAKPKTPTKARVRLAGNVAIDGEDGEIAESKKGITMADYDLSRGPYHAILDKMALARKASPANAINNPTPPTAPLPASMASNHHLQDRGISGS